ncbi:MAG: methyltransferase domain-containing protein [Deltaproteobacteria bacterium]|nr:methyltransferase domain-containing protein [Deltaproteobacteria bacterium]
MKPVGKWTCKGCASSSVDLFLEVSGVPVNANILHAARKDALGAAKGDVALGFCSVCGHVQNARYSPRPVEYTAEYENSLHFSPLFQDYARSLAVGLIERHNLYNKEVVEIGSGKGDFLNLICDLGGNRGVGFDPTYICERDENRDNDKVVFVNEMYSEKNTPAACDMLICRHVLEHLSNPKEFLTMIRSVLGGRRSTSVYVEVPNADYMLREKKYWDVIYEHASYFTKASLVSLLRTCSFEVTELSESFDGQFISVEASPSSASPSRQDASAINALRAEVAAFADRYRIKVVSWNSALKEIEASSARAVVWGAGSKGTTFLNILKTGGIEYVVDINPHKHGTFVPVSAQEIVGPGFLAEYRPEIIIVMNPVYIEEIWALVKGMGLKTRLLTA